jgi:hypothetical protein
MLLMTARFHRVSRFRPHFLARLVLCGLWAAALGCERSGPPGSAPRGRAVAVIGAAETHPQWPAMRGGALRYFDAVGALRATYFAPTLDTSDSLRNTVLRALQDQPDIVCLQVSDPLTADAAIRLILERGVLLVTFGEGVTNRGVAAQVTVDWPGGAELLADNLERTAGGRRSYLLLHDSASEVGARCYNRFAMSARRNSDLVLLEERDLADSSSSAPRLIETLLDRFSHAGLLVTLTPDVWLNPNVGWRADLRRLNAGFRIVTLSAAPVLWTRLGTPSRPGEMAALAGPLDGEIGYAVAQAAGRLLLSATPPPPVQQIACELVTPETLPTFAHRYALSAGKFDPAPFMPPVWPETAPAAAGGAARPR